MRNSFFSGFQKLLKLKKNYAAIGLVVLFDENNSEDDF